MKMRFRFLQLLVMASLLSAGSNRPALSATDAVDAYSPVADAGLRNAIIAELERTGESTTGRLNAFRMKGCSVKDDPAQPVTILVVQDRGQPRGEEYPTYVFFSKDSSKTPTLDFRTFAGKRLYRAETVSCRPKTCILSAQQGYSDMCLSDPFGRASPDLPGLRKDFWSDLIRLFGL